MLDAQFELFNVGRRGKPARRSSPAAASAALLRLYRDALFSDARVHCSFQLSPKSTSPPMFPSYGV